MQDKLGLYTQNQNQRQMQKIKYLAISKNACFTFKNKMSLLSIFLP